MPSLRRHARSFAVQILYQADVGGAPAPDALERFWSEQKASPKARSFATKLADATLAHQEAIDTALRGSLEEWRLERLPIPVRAILRLSACELLHMCEVPRGVIINEALELTRDFVDEDSARFVNAVLDKLQAPDGEAEGAGGSGSEEISSEGPGREGDQVPDNPPQSDT